MKSTVRLYGKYFLALCAMVALLVFSGCTTTSPTATGVRSPTAAAGETIMDILKADNNFDTLVAALELSNLDDTLSGAGNFTLFAPTDEAFTKMPTGTSSKSVPMKDILEYHVVQDSYTSAEIGTMSELKTVEGSTIQITQSGTTIMINTAKVTEADMMASNGVVHAIDTVLMPPNP